jgi:hypothetical protein
MLLHFLVGDSIEFEGTWEETERMEEVIRAHLGLAEPWRYLIHLLRDEERTDVVHVWVDDRVGAESYQDVAPLPVAVSAERRRRTVWVDGPPLDIQGKRPAVPYPWSTCYIEYFQIYHPEFSGGALYTVKYWERIEEIELYDPTELAVARMTCIRRL